MSDAVSDGRGQEGVGGRTSQCQSHRPTGSAGKHRPSSGTLRSRSIATHVHWPGGGEAQLGLESLVDDTVPGTSDEMRELDGLGALVDDLRVSSCLWRLEHLVLWFGHRDSRIGTWRCLVVARFAISLLRIRLRFISLYDSTGEQVAIPLVGLYSKSSGAIANPNLCQPVKGKPFQRISAARLALYRWRDSAAEKATVRREVGGGDP